MPLLSRCLAFVLLALAAAGLPAEATTLDDIASRKTTRIAVPQDFPPFGSVGPNLQPRGYDIDIAD